MNDLPKNRARQAGYSVVEVVIGVTVSVLVLANVTSFLKSGLDSNQLTVSISQLDAKAGRAVERIARQFQGTGASRMVPSNPQGASSLAYQWAEGFDAAGVIWGSPARIDLRYDPEEIDDGVDNDGDGLIDECQVVLVTNAAMAGEETRILAQNVREYLQGETDNGADDNSNGFADERGLCIDLDPVSGALRVRLSVEGAGPQGQILIRTVETSVSVRN